MKRISIVILLLVVGQLWGISTAKSVFYADSYMLRAQGVEANYWNPAKLNSKTGVDLWLPFANVTASFSNNALDVDTYNYFVTSDSLSVADKQYILKDLHTSLRGDMNTNISLFGMNFGNQAFSSTLNLSGKASISKNVTDMIFYGLTEEEYKFSLGDTNLSGLGYIDFTFGIGDISIPYIPENWPQIKVGASASLLAGLFGTDIIEYDGIIRNTLSEGATVHQDLVLKTGVGGGGLKAMVGMYSEVYDGLEFGLTVDNIVGFINWRVMTVEHALSISADDLYAANLEEDYLKVDFEQNKIKPFSTKIPPELRLALLYKTKYATVSTDWVHGIKSSAVTDKWGRISFGASLLPVKFLPISFGIAPGNSKSPLKTSYGIGVTSESIDFGIALQTSNSLFPNDKTRGLSFGCHLSFHY